MLPLLVQPEENTQHMLTLVIANTPDNVEEVIICMITCRKHTWFELHCEQKPWIMESHKSGRFENLISCLRLKGYETVFGLSEIRKSLTFQTNLLYPRALVFPRLHN